MDDAQPQDKKVVTVFLLILIAVAMEVAGQLLYKAGVNQISGGDAAPVQLGAMARLVQDALTNWRIIAGIIVYCGQVLVWWTVLSHTDVSYAFPLTSMSYVILLLGARVFLGERVSLERWLGTAAVVFGVYLITRSAPPMR